MKNEITYGDVDISEEIKKETKIRTTIFLEIELKKLLKKEALEKGIKYQQLLRDILKNHFSTKENLERRVKALETIILKKA